jgi:hypothetical protein
VLRCCLNLFGVADLRFFDVGFSAFFSVIFVGCVCEFFSRVFLRFLSCATYLRCEGYVTVGNVRNNCPRVFSSVFFVVVSVFLFPVVVACDFFWPRICLLDSFPERFCKNQ